jgi:hypothetical protein
VKSLLARLAIVRQNYFKVEEESGLIVDGVEKLNELQKSADKCRFNIDATGEGGVRSGLIPAKN